MDNETLPFLIKETPLILVCIGFVFYFKYSLNLKYSLNTYFNNFYLNKFLKMRFGFDYLYNIYLANFALNLSYFFSFKNIDKIFFEVFGAFNIINFFSNIMFRFSHLQTGLLTHYFGFMFLMLINFLIFFL
jgi:hypothetical protein